jgi:hypothetical protein
MPDACDTLGTAASELEIGNEQGAPHFPRCQPFFCLLLVWPFVG